MATTLIRIPMDPKAAELFRNKRQDKLSSKKVMEEAS